MTVVPFPPKQKPPITAQMSATLANGELTFCVGGQTVPLERAKRAVALFVKLIDDYEAGRGPAG